VYDRKKIDARSRTTYEFVRLCSFLLFHISFQMSIRSKSSFLPERLSEVLAMRSSSLACPADVTVALSALPFFRKRVATAQPARFGAFGGAGTVGAGTGESRFGGFRSRAAPPPLSEDGFETVCRGGRRAQRGAAPTTPAAPTVVGPVAVPVVGMFSSAAVRADMDVEDRMLARVKGKINKIGFSTYEQTKVFMQQILSSDETAFLDELMKFIFQKASTESAFCALYARLVHELADEFPHFRVATRAIFRDYVGAFKDVEAGVEPDPSSSDYAAFVVAQERKRARRGYSQFVAECVKLGEVETDAFGALLTQIVAVIEEAHTNSEKTLMCEEYIDCLANMCTSASAILCASTWSAALQTRIATLAAKKRGDAAGLSNKARYALMDLSDCARRGWKTAA
jgi:hypothetical protein